MTYLGTWGACLQSAVFGLAVVMAGCSDDGITPAASTGDQGAGSSGGPQAATSSVNTSDTVSASGSGDQGSEGPGPILDVPAPGTTSGFDESGEGSGGTRGTGSTDTATGDDATGEPPPPECVDAEECSCNQDLVRCDVPPPECPPDTVPLIDDSLGCWDGSCVPIETCFTVDDCSWCDDDEACVAAILMSGLQHTCQPIDPGCIDDTPTCECMPMACDEPFFECGEVPPGSEQDLNCYCPTC